MDITTLDGTDHGRWAVYTFTRSMCLLDLDRMTVLRHRERLSTDHDLRRDEAEVELLGLISCTVSLPMVLILDLRVPGVPFTTRTTSAVLAIFPFPLPSSTNVGDEGVEGDLTAPDGGAT